MTETPRRRNPDITKAAILQAARHCFADSGYDGVGVRDIAAKAGVTAALINRYFGSKQGLFAVAVPPTLQIAIMLDGDMRHFGQRAAAIMITKSVNAYDPMLALLRSAGSKTATPFLRDAVTTHAIKPLATRLTGANRLMRASLIIAQLTGFDVMMRALATDALVSAPKDVLHNQLAKSIQALVDDPDFD